MINENFYNKIKSNKASTLYERLAKVYNFKLLNEALPPSVTKAIAQNIDNLMSLPGAKTVDDVIEYLKKADLGITSQEIESSLKSAKFKEIFNKYIADKGRISIDADLTRDQKIEKLSDLRRSFESEIQQMSVSPKAPEVPVTPKPGETEFMGPAELEPKIYTPRSKKLREEISDFFKRNKDALETLKKNSKNDEEWYTNFFNFYIQEVGKQVNFDFFKNAVMSTPELQRGFISSTKRGFDEIAKGGLPGLKKWFDSFPMPIRIALRGAGGVAGLSAFGLSLFHFVIIGNYIPGWTGFSGLIFQNFLCNECDPSKEINVSRIYFCRLSADQLYDDTDTQKQLRDSANNFRQRYQKSLKDPEVAKVEQVAPSAPSAATGTSAAPEKPAPEQLKVGDKVSYPGAGIFTIESIKENKAVIKNLKNETAEVEIKWLTKK